MSASVSDDKHINMSQWFRPWKVILVPLSSIQEYLCNGPEDQSPRISRGLFLDGFVQNGDWDMYRGPISALSRFSAPFRQMEVAQRIEEDTSYVAEDKLTDNDGERHFVELMASMRQNGYLKGSGRISGWRYRDFLERNEILVAIGRDGRLIKTYEGGKNRMAAAMALGIDEVYVHVQGVHSDWARFCVEKHDMGPYRSMTAELNSICRYSLKRKGSPTRRDSL